MYGVPQLRNEVVQMQEALERRKRLRALQQEIEQGVQQFAEPQPPSQILPNPLAQEFSHNNNSGMQGFQAPVMQAPPNFQRPMYSNFLPRASQHRIGVGGRGVGANQFYSQQLQQNPYQIQQQPAVGFGISSLPQQNSWNQQQQQGFQNQMQFQQQQHMQQIFQQQVVDFPQQQQQQQFLPQQFQGGQVFSGKGGFKRKGGGGGRDSPRPYKKTRLDTSKLGNDFKTIEKHFFSDKFLKDPWKHFQKK